MRRPLRATNRLKRLVRRGAHSGLTVETLRRYAKSDLMEYGDEDRFPFFMHSARCPSFCDYACRGDNRGWAIAEDAKDFFQDKYSPNDSMRVSE